MKALRMKSLFLSVLTLLSLLIPRVVLGDTSLSVSPVQAVPGGKVTVQWRAPGRAGQTNWVGLYRAGTPADSGNLNRPTWAYVQQESGSQEFALPNSPGQYVFRLFYGDGYDLRATSNTFTVGSSTPPPPPPPPPALRTLDGCWNQCSVHLYQDGERVYFSASWKNPPGEWKVGWVIQRGEGRLRGQDLFLENVTWAPALRKGFPEPKVEYHMTLSADGNVLQGYPVAKGRKGNTVTWVRDKEQCVR